MFCIISLEAASTSGVMINAKPASLGISRSENCVLVNVLSSNISLIVLYLPASLSST